MFNRYTNGPDRELAIQQLIRLKDVKNYTDEQIKDTLTRNLLASFENNDPTSNMKYVPWIIQKYINGEIERLEDLNQVSSDLEIYDTYKNKKEFSDYIKNNYRIIGVDPNPTKSKNIFNLSVIQLSRIIDKYKPEIEIVDKGISTVVYEDDSVRVIVPKDKQAACYYGQGTRWCTAATRSKNYFDEYNKRGLLYILLDKRDKSIKHQLQIESRQYKDIEDQDVSLVKLKKDYPKFVDWLLTQKNGKELQDLTLFVPIHEQAQVWYLIAEAFSYCAKVWYQDAKKGDLDYQDYLSGLALDDKEKYMNDDYSIKIEKLRADYGSKISYKNWNTDWKNFYELTEELKNTDEQEIYRAIHIYLLENNDNLESYYGWDKFRPTMKDAFIYYVYQKGPTKTNMYLSNYLENAFRNSLFVVPNEKTDTDAGKLIRNLNLYGAKEIGKTDSTTVYLKLGNLIEYRPYRRYRT